MGNVAPIKLGEEKKLIEQIQLNRKAQSELVQIRENLNEVHQGLLTNATQASKELALAQQAYIEIPTKANLDILDESRANEVRAINNLNEFEKTNITPNEGLKLSQREKELMQQLIDVRKQKGASSLVAEHEQLKKKLRKLLPRFLSLTCEVSNISPGLLSIEKSLCYQMPELKAAFENEFKTIQAKLKEV